MSVARERHRCLLGIIKSCILMQQPPIDDDDCDDDHDDHDDDADATEGIYLSMFSFSRIISMGTA